jgi:hypothetical protein
MTGFTSGHPLRQFNLGFYFDFKMADQWYLNTGVLVKSTVGLNFLKEEDVALLDPTIVFTDSGTFSQEVNYFHVPVAIKYRFKNNFYLRLGPQFGLRSRAFLKFIGEAGNKQVEVKVNNNDLFHRFEVAVIGGIGYKLRKGEGMNIGIKYMYGLTNIMRNDTFKYQNRSLYAYIGIPIGRVQTDE